MSVINGTSGGALSSFGAAQQVTALNITNAGTDVLAASKVPSAGGVSSAETGDLVDISREAVNLVSNSHGFKANLKSLKAADEMTGELLSIKA